MATSLDLALWDAVAAVKAGYLKAEMAAAENDELAEEPGPTYEPDPDELAAVEAALAAGADPDRPLNYEEFRLWNQDKIPSSAPLLYPLPEEYHPGKWQYILMTPAELREKKRAAPDDHRPGCHEFLSADEYRVWYEANVKPMRFWVLLETLEVPQVLVKLLAAGANPNVHDFLGNYALHELIRCDYNYSNPAKIIRLLLAAGADVNVRDGNGQTPLQVGCWEKRLGGLLSLLLRNGASVSAIDDDGDTALHGAGFYDEGYKSWPLDGNEELRADPYDTDCGGRSEDTRIWGAREAVDALVEAGADPNAVNPKTGYTPMHWGSTHHGYPHLDFLETLFERGGDVCIPDHEGILPIDMHVEDDDRRCLNLHRRFIESLKAPARIEGEAPPRQELQFRLWRAVIGNHLNDVDAALADGAQAGQPISTAEMAACINARLGRKQLTPTGPGDAHDRGNEKAPSTTLHYAIFRALDKPEILQRLLAAGAQTDVAGYKHGHSPLHMLATGRFARPAAAASVLLAAGADVNKLDLEGRTPLQTACKHRADGALITLLLRHGARVGHRDAKGLTALEYATMKNSLSDMGSYYCRWIGDEYPGYSPDDKRGWLKRLFECYEEHWTQKDAEQALGVSHKL